VPGTHRKTRRPPRREPSRGRDDRPKVGQRLTVEINDIALGGEAIARDRQYVLFVAGAIPGERVEIEVTSTGRRYGRGRLVRVIHPAPSRVPARCRHFGECGGCAWQHIDYADQLRLKERLLRSTLEHNLPGVHLPIRPMIGQADPWGTRNKVHFLVGLDRGRAALGHFRAHSREFIAVTECPVHSAAGNRVARTMLHLLNQHEVAPFDESARSGAVRHVLVRSGGNSDGCQAVLVAANRKLRDLARLGNELIAACPNVAGVHISVNSAPGTVVLGSHTEKIAGRDRLVEEIAGVRFAVSPATFFQTSSVGAARLVETVLRVVPVTTSGPILDLYAGVGLFAAPLARRGHRVTAVEENPQAVADGIETLRSNGVSGCRFHSGKVEAVIKKLARGAPFDVVILDPPREGCPDWVLGMIARQIRPQRVIDVSCDPTALARDLAVLTRARYRAIEIQPIDMFPHTPHIESVAVLDRLG
jgi:23S rRNA (uracil1939-C5)-methyltransferase